MHYIFYKQATGEIIKTGICSKERFQRLGKEGEVGMAGSVIEGLADDVIQQVVNDKIVNKISEGIEGEI